MKKPQKQQITLALSCLACAGVALRNTRGLEGTEFSGLTGPLLSMADAASVLFVLALFVSFVYPRAAGATALVSSLLCLPLYLYFLAPVAFNRIFGFGHEFKVQPSAGFRWDAWAVAGVLSLAITAYVCVPVREPRTS